MKRDDYRDLHDQIKRLKRYYQYRDLLIWIVLMSIIAFLALSCTIPIIEVPEIARVSNCDSCYQWQYAIHPQMGDTLFIWSTDIITADSLTSVYSWFHCGLDTTIADSDSLIFNQMKCE